VDGVLEVFQFSYLALFCPWPTATSVRFMEVMIGLLRKCMVPTQKMISNLIKVSSDVAERRSGRLRGVRNLSPFPSCPIRSSWRISTRLTQTLSEEERCVLALPALPTALCTMAIFQGYELSHFLLISPLFYCVSLLYIRQWLRSIR